MAFLTDKQSLSRIFLLFGNEEQTIQYHKDTALRGHKMRIYTILQLTVHFIICFYLFVYSKFDIIILLLTGCSFIAAFLSLFDQFQSKKFHQQSIIFLSKACVFAVLIVYSKSFSNSTEQQKINLAFISGITLILNVFIFSDWMMQIISTCTCGVLFIVILQLGSFSWVVGGFCLFSFILSSHSFEKIKRLDFLSRQKYKISLKNWMTFIDTQYSDPIFSIVPCTVPKLKAQINLKEKISQLDPSAFVAHIKLSKYMNRESTTPENQIKLQKIIEVLPSTERIDGNLGENKNNFKSQQKITAQLITHQKFVEQGQLINGKEIDEEAQQKDEDEEKQFTIQFQNVACQKEFYRKTNQPDYFFKELKHITVLDILPREADKQFFCDDNNINQSQGVEKNKALGSVAQSRSAATANFLPAQHLINAEGSQNIQSNNQIMAEDLRQAQKNSEHISLHQFLAKRLKYLKLEEYSLQKESREENDDGYFEAKELDFSYLGYRIIQNNSEFQMKHYQIKIIKVFFQGKFTLMCVLKDITDKQQFKEKIQLDISRDRLLSSLLQEMKILLTKISSCSDSLTFPDDDCANSEVFNHPNKNKKAINSQSQYILQAHYQINDILDLFSLLNGSLEFNKKYFHLNSLLIDLKTIFQEKFSERNISLQFDCQVDQQERIYSDFQRVKQILVNLLSLSLYYVVEGLVSISFNFYDTKKETLEIAFAFSESVLPTHFLQQLSKGFSQQAINFNTLNSGKSLQLLLCSALIERLGPCSAFMVSQDDKNAEIRFKIFTNIEAESKLIETPNHLISFNNGTLFAGDSFANKRMLSNSTSIAFARKNMRVQSNVPLDITISEINSPARNRLQLSSANYQPTFFPQIPSLQQMHTVKKKNPQSPLLDKTDFESACLLTDDIMEKKDSNNAAICSKECIKYKSKSEVENNILSGVSGGGTAGKIGSTADTIESDYVNEMNSYLSNSNILIISKDENLLPNKQSIFNLVSKVQNIQVESIQDCHRALRKIIEAQNNIGCLLSYRLIILNLSSFDKQEKQENSPLESIYTSISKMQTHINKILKLGQIPLIIAASKDVQHETLKKIEENEDLAVIFDPISLENLTLTLRKFFFLNFEK